MIDDPSGNSYIENFFYPKTDPKLRTIYYLRSKEQMIQMGYAAEEEGTQPTEEDGIDLGQHDIDKQEVFHFHTPIALHATNLLKHACTLLKFHTSKKCWLWRLLVILWFQV